MENGNPPLLLIHGQMSIWQDYALVLPELSKNWHIYAVDVELPSNAVVVGTWNMHGAATPFGNNKIDFPGFPFPFGPEGTESESVWVSPGGAIRPKPRDENGEINTGLGGLVALPGESVLARSEGENGAQSLWWWHFYQLPDTNTPINAAITLYPDGTYDTLATNVWEYCVPIRPQAWLSISAPSVLMLNGNSNMVSAVFSAPYNVDATPTIECVKGAGLLDITTIDGHTLSVRGIAKSSYVGDIEFSDIIDVIWKEARVAVLCGAVLACTTFLKIMLVDRMLMGNNDVTMTVAAVVCITLVFTVFIAKLVGCTLPLFAKKLGFDPAVMASPFITTIVDALSLMIYMNVATLLLGI